MGLIPIVVTVLSLALFALSLLSLYLMLYTWDHPERLEASLGPRSYLAPRLSFTVLLPARHEEAVIAETIKRVAAADYPSHLLEVVVVCHAADAGTISEAQDAIRSLATRNVRVETFTGGPISKPRSLNVGFQRSGNQVVTVFDAEDDIDPDVFKMVNTVMLEEETGIVQAGVQLMNFRDHWFSVHNCLEYFFWFKSRLHFHAAVGMIPLGGNTVFMRRDLIERVGGWDEHCLTEDADIGLRLSMLGEPIRVVYDALHVTREETPATVGALMRQRTRWNQGFLQVLLKGHWRGLPRFGQRLLALYTLSFPIVQTLLLFLWPSIVVALIWLKVPTLTAMISFLPLYALVFQFLVTAAGARVFAREYGFRFPLYLPLWMAITFLPYQWLLSFSALRAVYREARQQGNWEKTLHLGAHRRPEIVLAVELERVLEEAATQLGVERGSVLLWNPVEERFQIRASRGLPLEVVESTGLAPGDGVAGWVAQTGHPTLIDGRALPSELAGRLNQPSLKSAIVLPIEQSGSTVAVVSVSSSLNELGGDAVRWLSDRVQSVLDGADPAQGRAAS